MAEAAGTQAFNDGFAAFFENELVAEADRIFRLGYFYLGDEELAFQMLGRVYNGLVKDLGRLVSMDATAIRQRLVQDYYQTIKDRPQTKPEIQDPLLDVLTKWQPLQRFCSLAVELCGLSPEECAACTEGDVEAIRNDNAAIRVQMVQQMVGVKGEEGFSDQDAAFLAAYVDDALTGRLSGEDLKRFDSLANQQGSGFYLGLQDSRGQMQHRLEENWRLNSEQLHMLRTFAENDVARAEHEARNIDSLSRIEIMGSARRAAVLLTIVAAGALVLYAYLKPANQLAFDPLATLTYEASALIVDTTRLDLPTSDVEEANSFVSRYPRLGFAPLSLRTPAPNVQLEGATVIDYEVAKIATYYFKDSSGEPVLFYQYAGDIDDLPGAQPGDAKGITYQVYSNDDFNILATQKEGGVVVLIMGTAGAKQLAQYAAIALPVRKS